MPVGRPTDYEGEKTCIAAYEACMLGATDQNLADLFGVNRDTIYEWKKVHPEFSDALRKGKDEMDSKVEKTLFERAMGYKGKQVKIIAKDEIVEADMHYPPDPTSMIFWLKNRQPDRWREKTVQEIVGAGEKSFFSDKPLTPAEFTAKYASKPDEPEE